MQLDNTINVTYSLTGGQVPSSDGPVIVIQLSDFDLNKLKLLPDLASGAENTSANTFLTLPSTAVRDSNDNAIHEISSSEALEAAVFISDINPPNLLGFDLDLNVGVITLNFSEAVNGTTIQQASRCST